MKSHLWEPFLFQASFLLASPKTAGHTKCLLLWYLSSYPFPDLQGFPCSRVRPLLLRAPGGAVPFSSSLPSPARSRRPAGTYSAVSLPRVRQKRQEIIISHRHVGGNIWVYPTFFASLNAQLFKELFFSPGSVLQIKQNPLPAFVC